MPNPDFNHSNGSVDSDALARVMLAELTGCPDFAAAHGGSPPKDAAERTGAAALDGAAR
ncbi:hypothetical protein ACFQLX_21345 [Streptomyces polyrhachis]|uniref:Uncharacterized protein n=1 Tax=Streptomyces polyrhachis TaxID=1282885 RepID=A0ABW2GKJ4_9ACTN